MWVWWGQGLTITNFATFGGAFPITDLVVSCCFLASSATNLLWKTPLTKPPLDQILSRGWGTLSISESCFDELLINLYSRYPHASGRHHLYNSRHVAFLLFVARHQPIVTLSINPSQVKSSHHCFSSLSLSHNIIVIVSSLINISHPSSQQPLINSPPALLSTRHHPHSFQITKSTFHTLSWSIAFINPINSHSEHHFPSSMSSIQMLVSSWNRIGLIPRDPKHHQYSPFTQFQGCMRQIVHHMSKCNPAKNCRWVPDHTMAGSTPGLHG
jgi:hypothetical protein